MTHFGTAASVTADILEQVWQDMDYRIDVYHVTEGSHIESV